MNVFRKACPQYMAMGMTYDQYWDGDVSAHKFYREAEKIRIINQNRMAWLQGMYVYNAVGALAPALKAFSKGRAKPYAEQPYDLFEDERKKREEREAKERYERIKEKVALFAKALNEKHKTENKGVEDNAECIP